MKKVDKIELTSDKEQKFPEKNFISFLDKNNNLLLSIPIEKKTSYIIIEETKNPNLYKENIWQVTSSLLKEKNVIKYIIEYEKNEEYFGYFYFENGEKIFTRPSDAAIICNYLNIPIFINKTVLNEKIKYQNEYTSIEEIDEEIKKALEEENYDLADELKNKKENLLKLNKENEKNNTINT